MALSLEKKSELVRLSLAKRNVPDSIIMQVKFVGDVSGSMQTLYRDGSMQELVDRLIPVAMRFDDNGELECYPFGSQAEQIDSITKDDFGNYIKKFLGQISPRILWSGTDYSTPLSLISSELTEPAAPAKKRGFFGSLFGKKEEPQPAIPAKPQMPPVFVLFQTDGETENEAATDRLLAEMASQRIYVMFIGVGRSSFPFLQRMADKYGHVGLVTFPDLGGTSDQQMYDQLLTDELCDWIKKQ